MAILTEESFLGQGGALVPASPGGNWACAS